MMINHTLVVLIKMRIFWQQTAKIESPWPFDLRDSICRLDHPTNRTATVWTEICFIDKLNTPQLLFLEWSFFSSHCPPDLIQPSPPNPTLSKHFKTNFRQLWDTIKTTVCSSLYWYKGANIYLVAMDFFYSDEWLYSLSTRILHKTTTRHNFLFFSLEIYFWL